MLCWRAKQQANLKVPALKKGSSNCSLQKKEKKDLDPKSGPGSKLDVRAYVPSRSQVKKTSFLVDPCEKPAIRGFDSKCVDEKVPSYFHLLCLNTRNEIVVTAKQQQLEKP